MSKDKRKRFSIYGLFGGSATDSSTKNVKSSKARPKSMSAVKSTSATNQKTNHRLTFTLPDESITNVDANSIPLPKPRDKRSSLMFIDNPTISTFSNNSSQTKISTPVSPIVKNTLVAEVNNGDPIVRPGIENRKVSESSLSSSVYPSSRNISNSTIEFSGKSSSVYPAFAYGLDHASKTTPKMKRSDLMAKRKPPMPLSVKTETPETKKVQDDTTRTTTDTLRTSTINTFESSDSEYTPLKLMPLYPDNASGPLSVSKELHNPVSENISNNEYEPPSFKNAENENSNSHKHSRTLSSIEEITSALEKFQLEHESSFQEIEDENENENKHEISRNSYNTNNTDDHFTIDQNTATEINQVTTDSEDEDNNSTKVKSIIEKRDSNGIYLQVKDLPEVKEGQKLDEYIEDLRLSTALNAETNKTVEATDNDNYVTLGKPAPTVAFSEDSSESDVFYDSFSRAETPRINSNTEFEGENVLQPGDVVQMIHMEDSQDDSLKTPTEMYFNEGFSMKPRAETLTEASNTIQVEPPPDKMIVVRGDTPPEEVEVPESLISDFNYDELNLTDAGDVDYSQDADLIGPLNKSFDSFIHTVRTRQSRISDDNSNSIVSNNQDGSVVVMDDGNWKRYDSITTTNFFNHTNSNDSNNVNDLVMPQTDLNQYDDEVVTPTDVSQNDFDHSELTPRREIDLENELDNNLTGTRDLHDSTDSINQLYPNCSENEDFDAADDDIVEDTDYEEESVKFGSQQTNIGSPRKSYDDDDYNNYSHIQGDSRTGSNSVLEFSPKTQFSFESLQNGHRTPEIYRTDSLWSSRVPDSEVTGTPTVLNTKSPHLFVIANEVEEGSLDNGRQGSIPLNREEKEQIALPIIENDIGEETNPDICDTMRKSTYDRREDPVVKPIEHSMIVTAAVPLHTSHTMKARRPPPNYPSAGRRSRGLSESTKHPELFMNGITNQGKLAEKKVVPGNTSMLPDSENEVLNPGDDVPANNDIMQKGEKCTYIEHLRTSGKKSTIVKKPSVQMLPLSIRQNGTIFHKKIPSVQLLSSYKSKNIAMKPKTRMLASEIDDGELPDATLVHSAQKTKIPTHPDAAVIEASKQFNRLAKMRSGDLTRSTSVMSVRPHYGAGMRLFVTNPDNDGD